MNTHPAAAITIAALFAIALSVPGSALADPGGCGLDGYIVPPGHINLVGFSPTAPDPANAADAAAPGARLTVTVLDLARNPVAGAQVDLRFPSGPSSQARIAAAQPWAGETVVCEPGVVHVYKTTDALGRADFVVVGGGQADPAPSQPAQLWVSVGDCAQFFGAVSIGIYDLNGMQGLAIADLSQWASDYFGMTNPMRSDYDADGTVAIADLSLWASAYFGGRETASAPTYCP